MKIDPMLGLWTARCTKSKLQEVDKQYPEFEAQIKKLIKSLAADFYETLGRLDQEVYNQIDLLERVMRERWDNIGKMNKQDLDDNGYL